MARTLNAVVAAIAMVLIASLRSAAAAPVVSPVHGVGLAPFEVATTAGGERQAQRLPGRYIVVYEDAVSDPRTLTDRLATAIGISPTQRFSHAIKGFAARLSDGAVATLRDNPSVAFLAPDRPATAVEAVPLETGDSPPTGTRRIEAAGQTVVQETSAVHVAVIDTGVDLDHPDLSVQPGTNCTGSAPPDDDNGHGTHVAGTIAARNNGTGVTGVAPGTTVFAVKVLDAHGSGSWSSIICGLDWVVGTRTDSNPTNDIGVANMSLGSIGLPVTACPGTDPLHLAICKATDAGVVVVVAAGNDGVDFDDPVAPAVPAAYPEVLTVTAMSDSDGRPRAIGSPPACLSGQQDDAAATFSNFAATADGVAHTIAAPGVCIRSTVPGGYGVSSGTSMAAPHVAGVTALCLDEGGVRGPCAGLTASGVVDLVRAEAEQRTVSGGFGFRGDPRDPIVGRYFGYLAWGRLPDVTRPSVVGVSPARGASGVPTSTRVTVTFSEPMHTARTEAAFALTRSNGASVRGTYSWSGGTMTFQPSASLAASTTYRASVSARARDVAGNRLVSKLVWRFRTAAAARSVSKRR
jgi:subtilisin